MKRLCLALFLLGPGAAAAAPPAAGSALQLPPYSPGLDVSSMDRSVDPCVDFFAYSCGGWIKKNPIPGDQPAWAVYLKMFDDTTTM
ncbi:MAG TPA: M13 family peptidase, partial [Thermoanaerobaculia bacterium]